jgi:DNA-binding NarL/FixJ family response regulator
MLTKLGCAVVRIVSTGEDSIASAKEDRPDIVVMDIRLAGKMDGIDAATAIVAERSVPIVFMTGYDDDAVRGRAMKIKPMVYVVKPIDLSTMKAAIGIQ